MVPLRPYQTESVDLLRAHLKQNPILCLATGAGKTAVAMDIMRRTSRRTLYLCDRRTIALQTWRAMRDVGLDAGLILAGRAPSKAQHQVAAIQTLSRRDQPEAGILFVDECRRSLGELTRDIIESYDCPRIGFDATPVREDGQGLGALFGVILEPISLPELQRQGYLAQYRYFAPTVPELKRTKRADYDPETAANAMSQRDIVGGIVKSYAQHKGSMLLFACTVKHSLAMRDALRAAGFKAEHVDGQTPEDVRELVFGALKAKTIDVVCNVDVVSYGFDVPGLDGVILARPTKSIAVHRQQCGRAMRLPGPTKILDHAGNAHRLGTPDAPVTWSLKDGETRSRSLSIALCRECYAVFAPGQACPNCGSVSAGIVVHEHDVPMAEVKHIPTKDEKRAVYRDLVETAHFRGYRKGWATHRYKARFGVLPVGVSDLLPSCAEPGCVFCDSVREAAENGYRRMRANMEARRA